MNPRKARFTELVHMTGRYQVYICHIWSTTRFLAFLVSAARRDVSDLDCLCTPLRDPWPDPSAQPCSKACFCLGARGHGLKVQILKWTEEH